MEKGPRTHEMSQENAIKCPLRNANEVSLLGFTVLNVVDMLVY